MKVKLLFYGLLLGFSGHEKELEIQLDESVEQKHKI